ncbi:MAG TPA: hypothetical protein VMZ04_04895, partial [Anaerolineae bacterium]|nr:hypothetical protein [Anaerolineae bacterium]
NVIDWIRNSGEQKWMAANHGSLLTSGVETKFNLILSELWNFNIQALLLRHEVSQRKGTESKYILNLEKSIVTVLSGQLFSYLKGVFTVRYEEMHWGERHVPVTVKVSSALKKVTIIFSVRNLFNEKYEEQPGLPAPGRWLQLGLEYSQ